MLNWNMTGHKNINDSGREYMNAPNMITLLRLLIIPIFGYYLYEGYYLVAAILLIAACLTDVLDGYIARRFDLITTFGKLVDPLADKLMQVTALLILTIQNIIPLFILLIIIVKELVMAIGGLLLYKKDKYVVQANKLGKIASASIYIAIVLILFGVPYSNIIFYIAFTMMMISFYFYIKSYFAIKKKLGNA
jgi:cardiolipin synthase (CMP-forming)